MPEAHVFFFRKEMFLGDQLSIGVKSGNLKRSSWVMEYRVERDTQLTAEGETPLICFNYQIRKPCRIPSEFRVDLDAFEGR